VNKKLPSILFALLLTAAAVAVPPALAQEGGQPCNQRRCGAGQFCCNFSCSICAPVGGFCTQQLCL
jgi:hypothetical protein